MKKLLGLLFLIVNLSATAQYSPNPGNYGSKFNRIKPLIAAHIPERDSTPPPDTDSTSTIYFDTVHLQLLVARHGLTYGFSGGSVIDTASLSNRINNCVLIANMPTYLASYLLSSSFDSMATALGYLKAFVQNSQLAHSSIFFQNSFGVNWNSSGVGTLGNNSGFAIDSTLFSTVNRLLDSIISVKALITVGTDTTINTGSGLSQSLTGKVKTLSINPTYNLNNQTNQGTIYQVLHGNSSGNTSYGFVNLATDVSGILPIASGGTGTATPSLVAGTNISITGSYPNQTINSTFSLSYPNTVNKYLNGYGNFVTLNSDSLIEGSTNVFFTNARARSAISLTTNNYNGAATYSSSTGIFNIPQIDTTSHLATQYYVNSHGTVSPGGSTGQVQINNAGAFGGYHSFSFNSVDSSLYIGGRSYIGPSTVSSGFEVNKGTYSGADVAMYTGTLSDYSSQHVTFGFRGGAWNCASIWYWSGTFGYITPVMSFDLHGAYTSIGYGLGAGGSISATPSAILAAYSTTQGFLMPRMTTTQMNAISSPATGLAIYNTTINSNCTYNGTNWQQSPTSSVNFSASETGATTVTVTLPYTMLNANYSVVYSPTSAIAVGEYISAQTTTSFTITYLTAITGTLTFNYSLNPQ